jgi:uncharacterized membrane protein
MEMSGKGRQGFRMSDSQPDERTMDTKAYPADCCKGIVPQDMFEILMNGVFAFVMTLFVKNNIPLPPVTSSDDMAYLSEYISLVFGDLITFLFTFVIFAILYLLFFEMLRNIRALDRYFVYLTFGLILSLIFMPLTSLLYSLSDMPIPYGILFNANILITGLIMIVLWKHTCRGNRLLYPGTDPLVVQSISNRLLLFPVTAVVGLFLDSWVESFGLIPDSILYLFPCIAFVILSREP